MDIGSICQQSVITVRHSDELTAAARLMREKHIGYLVVVEPHIATGGERRIGVRRLPVIGSLGDLAGVVSLNDIVNHLAGELQDVAGSIRNQRRIEDALRP